MGEDAKAPSLSSAFQGRLRQPATDEFNCILNYCYGELYGLLIRENYGQPVRRGFLAYTRSQNYLPPVELTEKDSKKAIDILQDIIYFGRTCFLPKRTPYKQRYVVHCCYKNICL